MAFVSHKLKLLYIHVPKTGGTTLTSVLRTWDPEVERLSERNHEPISFVAKARPKVFNTYLKIASVRNPWARTVSLFAFRKASLKAQQTKSWPPHWPSRDDVASTSFEQFLQKGAAEIECEICPPRDANRTVWLEPSCFSWVAIDGHVAVDQILRTESLTDDLSALAARLGLPEIPVPYLNKSHPGRYQSYFDSASSTYIANRYRTDVDAFGYSFDQL